MTIRIAIIASLGVLWVLVNLPASLVRNVIDSDQFALIAPNGTVWQGSARLVTALGIESRIQWQTTLWRPGLDLNITDKNSAITGRIEFGIAAQKLQLTGTIDASTLAPLLRRYDLFLPGTFTLNQMTFLWQPPTARMAAPSSLIWSGGDLRYILAKRQHQAVMPPLVAKVASNPQGELEARVVADDQNDAPLMILRWKNNGNLYFGVTRRMLRLANYPWSGGESESTLIFEVERKLTQPPG